MKLIRKLEELEKAGFKQDNNNLERWYQIENKNIMVFTVNDVPKQEFKLLYYGKESYYDWNLK